LLLQPGADTSGEARRIGDDVHMAVAADLLVGQDGRRAIARYSGRGALGAFDALAAIRARCTSSAAARRRRSPTSSRRGRRRRGRAAEAHVRPEFQAAFAVAIASLEPSARAAMKMHFLDGMTLRRSGRSTRQQVDRVALDSPRRAATCSTRRGGKFRERLRLPDSRSTVDGAPAERVQMTR
jgi:hypothetical protein